VSHGPTRARRARAVAALGVVLALVVLPSCSSSDDSSTPDDTSATAKPARRIVTIKGVDAGPDQYNRVKILEVGPADAENVLVLEPGTSAGAAYFRLNAEDIVARLS